jgi:threonine dehydrogenase-like Zn-dependent dehydrogenase
MNIFKRSEIAAGQTVAIVGIGFLGAILTRLATDAGARVIAISRRPYSLDVARQFGAAEVIPMEDHNGIIGQVKELTGGTFCDRVIEAVGKQWPLDLSAELTRERGRLIVAGYHQDGPRQVNMWLWNWRGLDVINAHERDRRSTCRVSARPWMRWRRAASIPRRSTPTPTRWSGSTMRSTPRATGPTVF